MDFTWSNDRRNHAYNQGGVAMIFMNNKTSELILITSLSYYLESVNGYAVADCLFDEEIGCSIGEHTLLEDFTFIGFL